MDGLPTLTPLECLGLALRNAGTDMSEIVARYDPRREQYEVCVEIAEQTRDGLHRGTRRWYGYGGTLTLAVKHAWDGDLGVWRFLDPEAWQAALYPAGRPAAGNPGPLTGQKLGRGDG